jgi:Cellulose biosynthesis protein BcsN
MKQVLAPLFALAAAGCSSAGMTARYDGLETKIAAPASRQVEQKDLLVKIPEWAGAVQSARQTNDASGAKQEIVLPGGTRGDNVVEVAIQVGAARNGGGLSNSHAPSGEDIDEELRAKFPGVAMRAVSKSEAGAETRYDLAVGRAADGTRCLYAWYWTENYRIASDPSGIAAVGTMFSQRLEPASLRIRLCSKYVKLDDLASLARQIKFVPAAETERIVLGSAATNDEAARSASRPPDTSLEDAMVGSTGSETPAPKAPTKSARTIPHKRVVREVEPINPPTAASPRPETAASGGPRYLAPPPLGGTPSAPGLRGAATQPVGGSGSSAHNQMLNLPAAALRGPVNGSNAKPSQTPGEY